MSDERDRVPPGLVRVRLDLSLRRAGLLRLGPRAGGPPHGSGGDRGGAAGGDPLARRTVRADRGRPHGRGGARPGPGRPCGPARGGLGRAARPARAQGAGRAAAPGCAGVAGRAGPCLVRRAVLRDLAALRLPRRRPSGRGGPAAPRPRALAQPPAGRGGDERGVPRLLGEHDFAAYCKRREGATTIRALRDVLGTTPQHREGTVRADAFCHNMVRALVGAMLPVGDGHRRRGCPGEVLAAGRATPRSMSFARTG